jgi:hypothetical protein
MGLILSCFETLFSSFFPTTPVFERVSKAKKYVQLHVKCRNNDANAKIFYQSNMDKEKGSVVERCYIPDEYVPWSENWSDYKPIEFTDQKILAQPAYADPIDLR